MYMSETFGKTVLSHPAGAMQRAALRTLPSTGCFYIAAGGPKSAHVHHAALSHQPSGHLYMLASAASTTPPCLWA
eukprot:CAMPEP_0172932602 /NCGR_PEP_ID=MMETSP1075-20121228/220080_1 /TAXON_ID=2916 /ORGANISM="Ceratium fusus, Strain PA161109" /LENGTH=74 /DNA_ID=CAMNT_0013793931 /DNA_START=93 /DNA_END=317 /DNA_ORIENTATION=+